MQRRDFIKLTAITGSTAALTACGNPENQLIRFVAEDDIVPGIAEWKPSVCPLCSAGCGLTVRVMDADFETTRNGQTGVVAIKAAKKLEGQASHPINRGGLCPRGQAAIQITYHPDRLQHPMKRTGARGSGQFSQITWDEAIGELAGQLDKLSDRKSLAYVTRRRSTRRLYLVAEFLTRFGAPPPVVFDVFTDDVLRRANAKSFGSDQLPTFDLARANYVISFGADFLGTWNSPVAQNAAYGEMRRGRHDARGKFVQVEPRMSLSGASADEWIPIKPGTEGVLALGLAHVLSANKAVTGAVPPLDDYSPAAVEKITGVAAARLERIARELAERRPAVAIVGGAALAQTNGAFHASAVNALNSLLGSVGQPGGVFFTPSVARQPFRTVHDLRSQQTQLLLLDDADLVFGSPKAWQMRDAIGRIPFVASFGSFIDDTTVHADLLLPDHTFLESWTDSLPESGSLVAVSSVAAPVMRPLYDTRSTPDVLIEVAGKLRTPIDLPWKSYDEMLKTSFDKIAADAWDTAQQKGFVATSAPSSATSRPATSRQSPVTSHQPPAWVAAQFDGDQTMYPFHFLPYLSQAFYDGSSAHLPWLQELPDPLTSAMWSSWVEINPQTAAKLNIVQGDLVEIASTQGSIRAPAFISPGIAPDVIAVPIGQGHESFTQFASGRGVNPIAILAPVTEPETGSLAWAATRVKISRVGDADGSLILFAGEIRENPHEHKGR